MKGRRQENIEEKNVSEKGSKVSVNILTEVIDRTDETKAGWYGSEGGGGLQHHAHLNEWALSSCGQK